MVDPTSARDGRPRYWLVEGLAGAAAAAVAITAAFATTPAAPPQARPEIPVEQVVLTSAPGPRPEPAALIAFAQPVAGGVMVSPFGLRKLPWEEGGRLHAGVDIRSDAGAPVQAVADGVVVGIGRDPGYGLYVDVRHAEGLTSRYAHLGRVAPGLRSGQALKSGAQVGEVGQSGSTTGPHLHFEIRDTRDRPLNPELFLGRRFAEADDLPLSEAQRFGRKVRIAQVSRIPASKRAVMAERQQARGAASTGDAAIQANAIEKMQGLQDLTVGDDGRPRAQLSF